MENERYNRWKYQNVQTHANSVVTGLGLNLQTPI